MSKTRDRAANFTPKESEATASKSSRISRRDFARDVAVVAATAALLPLETLAQTEKVAAPVKPPIATETALSPEAKVEAESNYQAVLRKYGRRLSHEQKAEVHRLLLQQQKSIEMLRRYPIYNGDGTATVLHLVTGEER